MQQLSKRAKLAILASMLLCSGFEQALGSTPHRTASIDSSSLESIEAKLDNLSARIRALDTSVDAADDKISAINDHLFSVQVSLFVLVGIVLLNIRMQRG